MQNMGTDEIKVVFPDQYHHLSDREVVGINEKIPYSGPLNKRPTREITYDLRDDAVGVESVKAANGAENEDHEAELTLRGRGLDKSSSSFGFSMVRNASARIRQTSLDHLKRLTAFSKKPPPRFDGAAKSAAAHALKGLKFISKSTDGREADWADVKKRFADITAPTNGVLPRAHFGECIGISKRMNNAFMAGRDDSNDLAGKLFDLFTRRHNVTGESITKGQLREIWDEIYDQNFDSRLKTFFDMVDKDANGVITEDEVREIITLSASANNLSNVEEQAEDFAALIMEELDPDNLGYIPIDTLESLLLEGPNETVEAGGKSQQLSQGLSKKQKHRQYDNPVIRRWWQNTKYFLLVNWQRIWVVALWIGVMTGLFAYKYVEYRNRVDAYEVMGHCVCMAKGAAETLKLNMALILLPVCRNTITWLRSKTKLGVVVPLDDNLNFHKVIAVGVTFGVCIHAIYHLTCDFPRLLHASGEKYELMEQYFGDQPKSYWYFVKSVEGITGILMVVLMAIAFTLAAPWFRRNERKLPNKLKLLEPLKRLTGYNAFWYSHHLFVIVYTLLIVHGYYLYLTKQWYKKTTWMYLAIPITLYACERLIRTLRSRLIMPVTIKEEEVFCHKHVLALYMSKPHGFRYKSGQYMFVNCAAVSPFEWHPFSITSAPGDDYLSVHINADGDWKEEIRKVFSEASSSSLSSGSNNPDFPRVLIDGPYGAPAQDYKKYEVVLLVGSGIGATPMISIVKDIVDNISAMEEEEILSLENGNMKTPPRSSPLPLQQGRKEKLKTRKAYFYWVTKKQESFDWFKDVMNEVAKLDHNNVIELHNHCTDIYGEGDFRSTLIAMLQSLNHAKNGVDIVSGTKVKSHFARPKWRNVYQRIADNHPDSRVGVFYCGIPALVPELRQLAFDFSHKPTSNTKFDFHKENF